MSLRVLTIDWQDGEEGELRKQDPGRFTSTAFPDVEMPGTCPVDSMQSKVWEYGNAPSPLEAASTPWSTKYQLLCALVQWCGGREGNKNHTTPEHCMLGQGDLVMGAM